MMIQQEQGPIRPGAASGGDASKVADQAKAAADEIAAEARHGGQTVREQAAEVASTAKDELARQAARRKDEVAEGISSLADRVHAWPATFVRTRRGSPIFSTMGVGSWAVSPRR